jgi:hypothetical protein
MVTVREIANVVVLAVILGLVLNQFGVVGAAVVDGGGSTDSTEDDLLPSGGSVTLSGTNVSVIDVHQSLNDSADLDGTGAITGNLGDDVADNRTVSTWAQIDNTSGVRQIASVDSRTILVFNGSTSEWACWSYDDASGETHRVAVSATSPGAWTNLQCERDSGTLTLRVNDTSTTTVQTDSANATAQTLQTTPLDGRVDETRTFNGSLTSSEQSALYSSPTAPLEGAPRQSRVMYDSYSSLDSIPVYISGGSLDGTAATKTAGLAGQGASEGTDWSLSGDILSLLSGGTLEGAPVVFVAWAFGSGGGIVNFQQLLATMGGGLRLLALVAIVGAAAILYNEF